LNWKWNQGAYAAPFLLQKTSRAELSGDLLITRNFGKSLVEAGSCAGGAAPALSGDLQVTAEVAQGAGALRDGMVDVAFSYGMAKTDVHDQSPGKTTLCYL
jgi:hypothetical protein